MGKKQAAIGIKKVKCKSCGRFWGLLQVMSNGTITVPKFDRRSTGDCEGCKALAADMLKYHRDLSDERDESHG